MDEAAALWKEYADACMEHDAEHGRHVLDLLIPRQERHTVDADQAPCDPSARRSLPSNQT